MRKVWHILSNTYKSRGEKKTTTHISTIALNSRIERRRAERMRLKLPVTVIGTNEKGKGFTENAFLEDLSSSGAYLFLSTPVSTDCRMSMIIDPERSGLAVKGKVHQAYKGG